jgi:hypothetical protein
MNGDLSADYLAGLPETQRAALARVSGAGWAKLREYLRLAARHHLPWCELDAGRDGSEA